MADFLKGVLVTLMIVLYIVSPVDFFPGPVDDFILLVFAISGVLVKSWKNDPYEYYGGINHG